MPNNPEPTGRTIILKTVVAHTVTYLVMGLTAFFLLDYSGLYAETDFRHIMRQTTEPIVMAGPLFQPLRGLIFGVVFVLLRRSWLEQERGWLRLWAVLVALGILGTFGPSPGSVEGLVYTRLPIGLHLIGLPEVLFQSLLLSVVVFYWVRHPENRWLTRGMGAVFCLALLLPALGLLMRQVQ